MGIVYKDRASSRVHVKDPADTLAYLINKNLNAVVSVEELEEFIVDHWAVVSLLAHAILDNSEREKI